MSASALVGRRTALRELRHADLDRLHRVATDPAVRGRWRTAGRTPDAEAFSQALVHGSQQQFVVVRRDSEEPVGLVEAYGLDHRSGRASISVLFEPEVWANGWPLEGVLLFARHMFDVVGCRKLYFDLPEVNRRLVRSVIGRFLTVEATLRGHDFHDGTYLDRTIASVTRDDWPAERVDEIVTPVGARR